MNRAEYLDGYPRWLQRILYPPLTAARARAIRVGIHNARWDLYLGRLTVDRVMSLRAMDRNLMGPPPGPLSRIAYEHTIVRAAMKKYQVREEVPA